MIELRDIKKNYGEILALRGVSTTIERGEIVGLLGQNGAGKVGDAILMSVGELALAALAHIFGLGHGAQELVFQGANFIFELGDTRLEL